jgi:hypothetical protein
VKKNSVLFWNIRGKKSFLKSFVNESKLNNDKLLRSCDSIFLSETHSKSSSSCLSGFDFYAQDGTPTDGRPSGGLEFYVPPAQDGKIISKTSSHICLKLKNLYLIGVYYKPTLEFDEKIEDLVIALSSCESPSIPIVLGGDFNEHSPSFKFLTLMEVLAGHGLLLVSDPKLVTFIGHVHQGTSTPDHVFCSSTLQNVSCSVPTRTESDHLPIRVEFSYPADTKIDNKCKKLNVEKCRQKLQEIDPHSLVDPEALADKIHEIFRSCQDNVLVREDNVTHRLHAMKFETEDLLENFRRTLDPFFKEVFSVCNKEFKREVAENTKRQNEQKILQLIEDAKENGIRALFNTPRGGTQTSLSAQVPLRQWYDCYSELYQSFDEPLFREVPVVPNEGGLSLIAPVNEDEVLQALNHQGSRAKGSNGVSPVSLKLLASELAPLLIPIYNNILEAGSRFPDKWLATIFFVLHKKGSFADPGNYRSLAIEDPFVKVFTTILCSRLTEYSESNGLLPDFQFGFRKNLSTTSATSLLKQCILDSFANKKRVYTCFVDYKKAFDLVNRGKLVIKLQKMGVPTSFCRVIFQLLADLRFQVRSNDSLTPLFESFNGVPQGDPLSPLLYSLFTADLPECLKFQGVTMANGAEIKYLLYADDLVLLSNEPDELRGALRQLKNYAMANDLTVNASKTKCMMFYEGRKPNERFYYDDVELEHTNAFTYLGVVFCTRLSAAKHVDHIISKCNAKVGFLFAKYPVKEIPLEVALCIFQTYVLPIITYSLPVWFPRITEKGKDRLNSLFTKFLKRYLGLPYRTSNAITHHIAGTSPLTVYLHNRAMANFLKVTFPRAAAGILITPPSQEELEYSVIKEVPTYFWLSRTMPHGLPLNPKSRRALLYDVIDLYHRHTCIDGEYHPHPTIWCLCKFCGEVIQYFHHRVCTKLESLTPCGKMKALKLF